MNISGIRPVDGFYNYNSIMTRPVSSAKEVDVDEAKVQSTTEANSYDRPSISQEEIDAARAKQTFGAYDYASQYDPTAAYSLKGRESELKNLDVERAISDMQRDEAIHQYQYFVGNRENKTNAGGMEDFSL